MAKRKVATKAEKEMIDRLAHAFVCTEIGKNVFQEHEKSYLESVRKKCPQWFRLLDEFQAAVPRVRKQLLGEFEKGEKVQTHE